MFVKLAVISLNTERKNLSQYYNSQAEGMARALAALGHEVSVYHLVPDLESSEEIVPKDAVTAVYLKCRHVGKHAFVDTDRLDREVACYLTASDNYLFLGKFYRWCEKNHILCLPYIGVVHSNNASAWKRKVVDLFCDNIKYYRKIPTIAKTPALADELRAQGAKRIYTVPVGLDRTLLKTDYMKYDRAELKRRHGFEAGEKIVLFVGRLTAEKQPVKMIDIFQKVCRQDDKFRLVMIGQGELDDRVRARIAEYGLTRQVTVRDKIPNKQMWEFYRLSDCFVNLNTHEIFGMAILEAMYYENTVIALDAPGPSYIIENGVSGHVCDGEEAAVQAIVSGRSGRIGAAARKRVEEHFVWDRIAERILEIMSEISERNDESGHADKM